MLKSLVGIVGVMILANRALFAMEEFKRLSIERATDIYMNDVCQQIDYKRIGRHASICADIQHRLSNSLMFHVSKSVVNNTLYQEATLYGIVQMGLLLCILMMVSTLHGRYVKTRDISLPTITKKLN